MATKIFDNDFLEKKQAPDPNDTLLIADHTQSGNPVRKIKVSTLLSNYKNRVFDGGTPSSLYGGSRTIDCGGVTD